MENGRNGFKEWSEQLSGLKYSKGLHMYQLQLDPNLHVGCHRHHSDLHMSHASRHLLILNLPNLNQ